MASLLVEQDKGHVNFVVRRNVHEPLHDRTKAMRFFSLPCVPMLHCGSALPRRPYVSADLMPRHLITFCIFITSIWGLATWAGQSVSLRSNLQQKREIEYSWEA